MKERWVQNNEGRVLEVYGDLECIFRNLEIILCRFIVQNFSLNVLLYGEHRLEAVVKIHSFTVFDTL